MDLYPITDDLAGTSGALGSSEVVGSIGGVASRGSVAPADGNYRTAPGSNPGAALLGLGPNNELLDDAKPELVNALRELVRQYRAEGVTARRHEIRRIRQARLFWQGHAVCLVESERHELAFAVRVAIDDDRQLEEMPRYQFVTNFYQGFGLSFVAVLSQDVPSVRFYPQSAQSLDDIATARAASDVADLIEQNNQVEKLLTAIGYFLWTDGKLGAYVRYVADAQRFGTHEETLIAALEVPLGEDKYVCPECGKETPVKHAAVAAADSDDADENSEGYSQDDSGGDIGEANGFASGGIGLNGIAAEPTNCSGCGAQMSAENCGKPNA